MKTMHIALRNNSDKNTVLSALKRLGIKARHNGGKLVVAEVQDADAADFEAYCDRAHEVRGYEEASA